VSRDLDSIFIRGTKKSPNITNGKTALYVDVDWDTLLDPAIAIFPRTRLSGGVYEKMHWEPQASGIRIPNDVAEQFERDWAKFLNRPIVITEPSLPEEVETTKTFFEGATRQVTVNVYERNAEARTICITWNPGNIYL